MKLLDRQDDITAYSYTAGEAEAGSGETNPPRNSQSETHPDDERGVGRRVGASIIEQGRGQ
jgi:hypothetical protein